MDNTPSKARYPKNILRIDGKEFHIVRALLYIIVMTTNPTKAHIKLMHQRKAYNAKNMALTLAYIQVIGRSIKADQPFSTSDVRDEIASNKTRYGKLDKWYLAAHLPSQIKTWISQGKIVPCEGEFIASKYGSAPLQLYRGIDHSQYGGFLK